MIQLVGCKLSPLPIAAVALLLCVGCGEVAPQRFPVSGTVTLDGMPVERATIILTPIGEGLAAAGVITAGKFSMTEQTGPTVGDFQVRINPMDEELEEVEEDPGVLADSNRRPRIPKIYQQNGTLTATITGTPDQTLDFELSSKQ